MNEIETRFHEDIKQVRSEEDLLRLKSVYLGKKGHVSAFLRGLGGLPVEARPMAGAQANQLKQKIEDECRRLLENLSRQKREKELQAESVDITLPGRAVESGGLHPVTQVMEEVEVLFREIGFDIFEGPEIETDYYNFEALNIPKDHPARDMQDTFYLGVATRTSSAPSGPLLPDHLPRQAGEFPPGPPPGPLGPAKPDPHGSPLLLRTHTSPVQIHVMKKMKPPIRMIAPGAVYRRDSDISHTPMFHQVEGLVVDEQVRFSDLKGTLFHFLHRFFGPGTGIRLRPSYFPFTEPSAEVDIQCVICKGGKLAVSSQRSAVSESCRLCKGSGWLEVMGCGLVHPAVFEKVGYDTSKISGFAFGMGIERLAMLKFGIPDIRLFFENDLRFLKQL